MAKLRNIKSGDRLTQKWLNTTIDELRPLANMRVEPPLDIQHQPNATTITNSMAPLLWFPGVLTASDVSDTCYAVKRLVADNANSDPSTYITSFTDEDHPPVDLTLTATNLYEYGLTGHLLEVDGNDSDAHVIVYRTPASLSPDQPRYVFQRAPERIASDTGDGYQYYNSSTGTTTTTPTSSMPSTIFSSAVEGDIIYRGSDDWYYLNKPGSNGTFFLKCVVSGGTPVLSWQEASAGICS